MSLVERLKSNYSGEGFFVDTSKFYSSSNSIDRDFWEGSDVENVVDDRYLFLGENRVVPDIRFTPIYHSLFSYEVGSGLVGDVFVSKKDYELKVDGVVFPIALSDEKTPIGEFYVVEKWTNPFWKSKNRLWVPGKENPIGSHLIILGDSSGRKLNAGIHKWIQWEYSSPEFKQGDNGQGCLRTRPEDMGEIFETISLGSRVYIK